MLNYRIKKITNLYGSCSFHIQRKRLGIWWNVYVVGEYDAIPWIFEFIFGYPKAFRTFEDAKDWIIRRLKGKKVIDYYYYPFEDNYD